MFAKDIMTTNVITVDPDTPVFEIAALLAKHGISAAPVIGGNDRVIGMVSEGDLVQTLQGRRGGRRSWWLELIGHPGKQRPDNPQLGAKTAKDVMSRDVICVDYFSTIPAIAELLEKKRIKRVPVISHGRLVGIVSRANLVQFLALQNQSGLREVLKQDELIRQNLLDKIQQNGWSNLTLLNVLVSDCVVTYWGLVDSLETKECLCAAAAEMPEVKSVEANMGITTLLEVKAVLARPIRNYRSIMLNGQNSPQTADADQPETD